MYDEFLETVEEMENPGYALELLQESMIEHVRAAERILKRVENNKMIYERARSYWIPHIIMALTNDHEWLGGSMVTMEETIMEVNDNME